MYVWETLNRFHVLEDNLGLRCLVGDSHAQAPCWRHFSLHKVKNVIEITISESLKWRFHIPSFVEPTIWKPKTVYLTKKSFIDYHHRFSCAAQIVASLQATRGSADTHRGCCCLAAQVLELIESFSNKLKARLCGDVCFTSWEYFTYLVTHCVLVYPQFTFLLALSYTAHKHRCTDRLAPPPPSTSSWRSLLNLINCFRIPH